MAKLNKEKAGKEKTGKQTKVAELPKLKPELEAGTGLESPTHGDMDHSGEDWVLHNWSTSLTSQVPSFPEAELLDEIGRYFTAISKEPSRARSRRNAAQAQGPRLKRLSAQGPGGSLSKDKGRRVAHVSPDRLKVLADSTLDHSQESIHELLPPLQANQVHRHDGQVVRQSLEDTTGVEIPDPPDLFVTKSKTRLSIIDMDIGSRPGSASHANRLLEPAPELMTSDSSPSPSQSSGGTSDVPSSPSKSLGASSALRTSLLLDTKEEGDKETK